MIASCRERTSIAAMDLALDIFVFVTEVDPTEDYIVL